MKAGAPRRSAILVAAENVLLRDGPRATSMEALARAAGVAKPTLYAYFADKEAILAALADELISRQRQEFEASLTGGDDLPLRIAAALAARCKQIGRLKAEPHRHELYGQASPIAAPLVRDLEAELVRRMETELSFAGVQRARLLAQLLMAASTGIGEKATAPAEIGPALRLLCERLIRPELPA